MRRDLTKSTPPLIIRPQRFPDLSPGEGRNIGVASIVFGRDGMRIHIYKDEAEDLSVLVEPSPGKGRHPVYLPRVTAADVVALVLPVVEKMRAPKVLTGDQLVPF